MTHSTSTHDITVGDKVKIRADDRNAVWTVHNATVRIKGKLYGTVEQLLDKEGRITLSTYDDKNDRLVWRKVDPDRVIVEEGKP